MSLSTKDAIHALILTHDESAHIGRCIHSLRAACSSVLVVDSGSTDDTVAIAEGLGADVVLNPWVNYSTQMNFGIARLQSRGGWILRIDADEYLSDELAGALGAGVAGAEDVVDGFTVSRAIVFLGRRVRFGGIGRIRTLRLFRSGRGSCEDRWMDEHIVVSGRTLSLPGLLVDHSLKPLGWWIEKHNMYASREAVDLLNMERQFLPKSVGNAALRGRAKVRRVLKERLYRRLPGGLRAFVYFAYRFVFRLGFLDGRAASFHVLQGFWYRYLVDLKVMEVRRFQQATGASVVEAIRKVLGIDVDLHTNRSA